MAATRIPGPYCPILSPGAETVVRPAGQPTPPAASYALPGHAVGERGLTPEQEELALDVAQLTLDVIGVFEPTPFADGANALISVGRRDWLGAGLSGLGMIPYLGDLAKIGKLPRYAAKIRAAIDAARRDVNFARYLRPALQRLKDVLDSIPVENLSPRLRAVVDEIKQPLDSFLGGGGKNADGGKNLDAGGGSGGGGSEPWWEVEDVNGLIDGTSVPKEIKMRVGGRRWEITRNEAKLKDGKPIGPATKHLGERGAGASEWAKRYEVDYPMSSVAGALEEFEKRLLAGKLVGKGGKVLKPGDTIDMVRVGDYELSINTSRDPWRVFHILMK